MVFASDETTLGLLIVKQIKSELRSRKVAIARGMSISTITSPVWLYGSLKKQIKNVNLWSAYQIARDHHVCR
jgi:hypothetical protein